MVWSWRDGPAGDVAWPEVFDVEPRVPQPLPDGPIVVAVAYNEELRLPDFLRHHREIGASHFIIVDNASTDATAALLDAAPDVTRLSSSRPFRSYKKLFRPWIADRFLVGRWVLMPDIDEHFVYPGWPDLPLPRLIARWEDAGAEAVFAPMVDMYPDGPVSTLQIDGETRLREVCDRFDGSGYWLEPLPESRRRNARIPPYLLYGGPRDRLFTRKRGLPAAIDAALRNGPLRLAAPSRGLGARLARVVLRANRREGPSQMSKVPLLRWRYGITFPGSNHRVRGDLRLAEDWGALLHFKYLPDFRSRSEEAAARGQHSLGGAEYRTYLRKPDLTAQRLGYAGTRQLRDWRDLSAAGLLRTGPPPLPALDGAA